MITEASAAEERQVNQATSFAAAPTRRCRPRGVKRRVQHARARHGRYIFDVLCRAIRVHVLREGFGWRKTRERGELTLGARIIGDGGAPQRITRFRVPFLFCGTQAAQKRAAV